MESYFFPLKLTSLTFPSEILFFPKDSIMPLPKTELNIWEVVSFLVKKGFSMSWNGSKKRRRDVMYTLDMQKSTDSKTDN